jgi:dimethylhistidine N-methyltransferase
MKDNLAYSAPETTQLEFRRDLQAGLARQHKSISPKYFYDSQGSRLFDRICTLPEYYPTRTELAILQKHRHEIASLIGPHAELVEFGAGSMDKVRILLNAMDAPLRYTPIDISEEHLLDAAKQIRANYPSLQVMPLTADYTQPLVLPNKAPPNAKRVGLFLGSTLGNFEPLEAQHFMHMCAKTLAGGALVLGVDLVKDPALLHAAYNDAQGITAEFNRNVLHRANRELGTGFDTTQFTHSAFYNAPYQRIEMHLMSTCEQRINIDGTHYRFEEGETLHTENSYKFTAHSLRQLAVGAGFTPRHSWTDPNHLFCLVWLDAPTLRS